MILAGKRLLITGVITRDSIAYHAAEQAQKEGAEVLLTSFGRVKRMTERAAQRLPQPVDVLELDVNRDEDLAALVVDVGLVEPEHCATSTTFTHQRQLHLPIDLLASSPLVRDGPRGSCRQVTSLFAFFLSPLSDNFISPSSSLPAAPCS